MFSENKIFKDTVLLDGEGAFMSKTLNNCLYAEVVFHFNNIFENSVLSKYKNKDITRLLLILANYENPHFNRVIIKPYLVKVDDFTYLDNDSGYFSLSVGIVKHNIFEIAGEICIEHENADKINGKQLNCSLFLCDVENDPHVNIHVYVQ